MGIGIKNAYCCKCNCYMENVNTSKKYCDPCNKELKRQRIELCRLKKQAQVNKIKIIECDKKFKEIATKPFHLTSKGFNSVSNTRVKSYVQLLDCKWIDIIERHNRLDELFDYVLEEYVFYMGNSKKQNLHTFSTNHKYITYDLLVDIGLDKIMVSANVVKKRYSDQDLVDNFQEVRRLSGRIPLFNDFEEHSKIPQITYANRYKLKGKLYDNIVKKLVSEEEFIIYLQAKKSHKSKVGKITGPMSTTYSLDDLEMEFRRVFDDIITTYGCNPPRRLFNKLSKIDDRTYRKRLKKSWLDVCAHYGYTVEREAHNSEKILLQTISKLLNCEYIPQKTWGWLIGSGGKHMYCDGYFEDINLVVEFDGKQHRKPVTAFGGTEAFLRLQKNDSLKEKLLEQEGIHLIRIDSRMPWHDVDYLIRLLTDNGLKFVTQQDAEFFITSRMQCASI